MATKSYRGNCHCGTFVYTLEDVPEIHDAVECNCSICRKKGYLFLFTNDQTKFSVVKGDEEKDLTSYTFGPGNLSHKFCNKCGTALFVTGAGKPLGPNMGINLHALQDFDTWSLARKPVDGAAKGDTYAPPQHTGDLPSAEIPNGKLYKGSCHCGDVTVAMVEEELEGHENKQIIECNCSICERIGAIWVYPQRDQVVLSGIDKASLYPFGNKMLDKVFCKRCGVFLANPLREMTPDEIAALSERARKHIEGHGKICPINTRVLEGLDLTKLKVARMDGRGKIPDAPKDAYVNV